MVERGYDAGVRREDLQPARRLRQLRLPGKPRGVLRADRLCLVLDEVLASGRVLRRAAQRPADGLLRAGADRARRPRPWRRGPAGLRQRLALGLHAGADRRRRPLRRAAGLAHGARPGQRRRRRDRRRARRPAVRLASTISGAGPACRSPRWSSWPRPTPSRSLGLARREALWAIKALRDEPLPLFAAAAAREHGPSPEIHEPQSRSADDAGREVVEDYRHVGLTLRQHPVAFLRADLASRRHRHLRRGDERPRRHAG